MSHSIFGQRRFNIIFRIINPRRLKQNILVLLLILFVFSSGLLSFYLIILSLPDENEELPGWGKNRSRKVHDFINISASPILLPHGFCQKKHFLTVMVTTNPRHFLLRKQIRVTWGKKREGMLLQFLVGRTNDSALQTKLENEYKTFNDLIQEDFFDSYLNLTIKSIALLKVFSFYCQNKSEFLLKSDDDVVINMPKFIDMLSRQNTTNFFMGEVVSGAPIIRKPREKWYIPRYLYPGDSYPDYIAGPVYIMSQDVAQKLYRCTLEGDLFPYEDVQLSGFCAKKFNIPLQNNPRFSRNGFKPRHKCGNKSLITIHYVKEKEMVKIHKILEDGSKGNC